MREILFHGKRTDTGEWVYGWYCPYPFGRWPLKCAIVPSIEAERGSHSYVEVDHNTVGQYTGLNDKNGKQVFEGDIVRLSDDKRKITIVAEVRWQNKHAAWAVACYNELGKYVWNYLGDCPQSGVEVVGNRHDNPELLGERK